METTLTTKTLDHLGLVSGMFDELGIGTKIDKLLNSSNPERKVSIGQICKALVLNSLGFSQRTLYLVSHFFEDKPVELLLGEGVQASHLNDSVLGRGLDELYAYGCTELYSQLAPQLIEKLNLSPLCANMDLTSFHLDGKYNAEDLPHSEDKKVLHLTKGYSRDHRPDLNQVVLNLITDNQAGIPLHMEALHGNTNDKSSFRSTIKNHIDQLHNVSSFSYLIMDSAGYTKETIQSHGSDYHWITRVPENIKACKNAIQQEATFTPLSEKYSYHTVKENYGGIEQRWLVIHSKDAYKREIETLKKNYLKKSEVEQKAFLKLCKTIFSCENDALKAFDRFEKECKYLHFTDKQVHKVLSFKSKGRPKKDAVPDIIHYTISASMHCSLEDYEERKRYKGRFVIATNQLNKDKLTDKELFDNYKGQAKVERGFRFLKDPQFVASSFFVKNPERIEALLFIMTLCLTVYASLEHRTRQVLKESNETLPNQVGKEVQTPTMRWIFSIFKGVHVLYGTPQPVILNKNEVHTKLLELLGDRYKKYYFS